MPRDRLCFGGDRFESSAKSELRTYYWNMAWSYIALLAAAFSEVVVRLSLAAGAFTGPWQVIVAGLAIAVVFVIFGMIMLPRLKRTAMVR